MQGIVKNFGNARVLQDVRLQLHAGEVHALMGENGAGKSTLMKILAGVTPPDEGTIYLNGEEIALRSPRAAQRAGIALIHQELNLVNGLSIAANVFLGHEPRRFGWLDEAAMRRDTQSILRRLDVDLDVGLRVGTLSVAERQVVAIAKALRGAARLVIMDEPTAALAEHEAAALFRIVKTLCEQDVAVVYISHRMDDVFALAKRITVLRDGQCISSMRSAETNAAQVVEQMVGRPIGDYIPKTTVSLGDTVLRVKNVQAAGLQAPISFEVRAGEIVGIGGLMGSGRTALARALFGANPLLRGEVCIGQKCLSRFNPRQAIAAGVGLVTEDRQAQGLLLQRSVTQNMTLPTLRQFVRRGVVRLSAEQRTAQQLRQRLRIRLTSLRQHVATLSGGNQQKVVLAKWLQARCSVLILDEPTRGIDVAAKTEIYQLLGELVQEGTAIVLVSSDLPELLALSDRVLVLRNGTLAEALEREDATANTVMRLALGE